LRVKAIYDNFKGQFGVINLPLLHEIKSKNHKKLKIKFKNNNVNSSKGNNKLNRLYNSIARKSVISMKSTISTTGETFGTIIRRESFIPSVTEVDLYDENNDKMKRIQTYFRFALSKTFIIFTGYIQDIIFNVDNVGESGVNDDKYIIIPSFLKDFLKDNPEDDLNSLLKESWKDNDKKKLATE
jgi:hypothetical protein